MTAHSTPHLCGRCERWFIQTPGMGMISCTVLHSPGECCHYSETEVSAPRRPVYVSTFTVRTTVARGLAGCCMVLWTLWTVALMLGNTRLFWWLIWPLGATVVLLVFVYLHDVRERRRPPGFSSGGA